LENKNVSSNDKPVVQQYSCHMHEVTKRFIQPFHKN